MLRVLLYGSLALLVCAAPAAAKAPTLEELPTVKAIQDQAGAKIEEARRAAAAAEKDPKKDLIEAYANGTSLISAWKEVAEILKSDSERPAYRKDAAEAFRARFRNVAAADTRMDKLKREIALSLLKLLNDRDVQVRVWVHSVFTSFWQGRAEAIGYKPESTNPRERHDALKAWQKFLTGR